MFSVCVCVRVRVCVCITNTTLYASLCIHACIDYGVSVIHVSVALCGLYKLLESIMLTSWFTSLRVTKDITTVKQEATLLSEQMQLVKEDITRVSKNTVLVIALELFC